MTSPIKTHSITTYCLVIAGALCLLHGLTKPLLWFAGKRTTALIRYQENTVTARGAYWVRYAFSTPDGLMHTGTAMTAVKSARLAIVRVAYLPSFPGLNMPAYGGYAALMGAAWSGTGLMLILAGRVAANAGRLRHKKTIL